MAKVSTIVAVYNGAATVDRALRSIFAQTFTDNEVVVVNDGSTDDTASVLSRYGDRIRVITQPNRGVAAARNAGVRASRGDYVAFLDDDDEWMPEKLARCVAAIEQDKNCVLVYTDLLKVNLKGEPMPDQTGEINETDSPTMAQLLALPWNVVPSRLLARRSAFVQSGGFDERFSSAACEDMFFLLCIREVGHFQRVPEVLLRKPTRPLYPKALNREPQCDLFVQLVRDRYGASGAGLIREFRRKRVKTMRHMARVLMSEGRAKDARKCLARLIHYQPTSPKAYRRYLETFVPRRV